MKLPEIIAALAADDVSDTLEQIEGGIDHLDQLSLKPVKLDAGTPDQLRALRHDPHILEILAQNDKNLTQLERIAEVVERTRRAIQCQQNNLKTTISPINLCPPEVLDNIFLMGLWFDEEGYPLIGIRGGEYLLGNEFALPVSYVCSKWRVIALHQRDLWTRISTEWPESLQEEFISRARGKPLHIYNMRYEFDISLPLDDVSDTWASITMTPPSRDEGLEYIQDNAERLTALERITVHCLGQDTPMQSVIAMSDFDLPSLKSINLAGLGILDIQHIPHLTHLYLESTTFDPTFWTILPTHCPNLKSLSIKHLAHVPMGLDTIKNGVVLVLPQLETLEIHRQNDTLLLHSLLEHVRAPRLKRFAISFDQTKLFVGGPDIYWRRYRHFLPLFLQSSPLIERMALSDDMFEIAELLAKLLSDDTLPPSSPNSQKPARLLPGLRELRIFRMIIKPDQAARVDLVERPFARLLPQLQELVIQRGCPSYVRRGSDCLREAQTLKKLVLVLPVGTIDSTQRAWFSDRVADIDITCMDWTLYCFDDQVMENNIW